ncbi:hypothetical protein, partial [Providencia rettgeri]|uniref:hypothetical protein n=1 Tax=Providencia rettgeri TaxID=587 RepID=UPI0030196211
PHNPKVSSYQTTLNVMAVRGELLRWVVLAMLTYYCTLCLLCASRLEFHTARSCHSLVCLKNTSS